MRWAGYERLQTLCKHAGIENPTQLAISLARQEGDQRPDEEISVSGPAGWWKGERKLTIDSAAAVCRLTGGSMDWLVLGIGDMIPIAPESKEIAFDQMAAIVDRVRSRAGTAGAGAAGSAVAGAQKRLGESRTQQAGGAAGRRDRGDARSA